MRNLLLFAVIFSFALPLYAQKKALPAAAAATTNTRPASVPLTESLVLSKIGSTKVKARFLKTYPAPALEKNREILYFLYERFTGTQVKRIIELTNRPGMTSGGYDSLKSKSDQFIAYLVKPFRQYWVSDGSKFFNVALLYIPYSEKENFNDLYTIKPGTEEGVFVVADYTAMESISTASLPPVPQWEDKPLMELPNYKAEHPGAAPPVAENKTTPAGNNAKKPGQKNTEKEDPDAITENQVFAKVGKVKVKVPYYSVWNNGHAALNRKKEFMYFLFEKFTPKQVKRIVELSEHRSVYSGRYEDIKYVMTGYLVTYGRYYENPNWDNWKNYALLYLPYSENSKGEVEEWWTPKTKEGTFILAEYSHLEYADGTPRKGTEKWGEKPFTDIAGYSSDWEDILKADQTDLNTVKTQSQSETPGANSKDPAVAAFATAFGKVIQQGLNGIEQTNNMVDAIEKAIDGSAKGNGDAVNENALNYNREIKNAFLTAMEAFEKVKSGIAEMNERSISSKCSSYYDITKAKDKVSSAITDILYEKNLLNTYINLCKIEYLNRTYYSQWKENVQNLRTRYISHMQEYVRRAHEGLKELKSAAQPCLSAYIK